MLAALDVLAIPCVALIETGLIERAQGLRRGARIGGGGTGPRDGRPDPRVAGPVGQGRGDLDRANELFAVALDRFGPDDPFLERVLLLHAHGQLQLDRGERKQAVATLHTAHRSMLSVGAEPFASRVESDLKRAGARTTRRSARSSLELTDREHDVAVLVAKGYSNPEAASELYVSRKAIEYHLRNIYGKLGIASRRELRGLDL